METRTGRIVELPEGTTAEKSGGRMLVSIPPAELPTVQAMPHGKRLQWAAKQLRELKREKRAERKRQRKARRASR